MEETRAEFEKEKKRCNALLQRAVTPQERLAATRALDEVVEREDEASFDYLRRAMVMQRMLFDLLEKEEAKQKAKEERKKKKKPQRTKSGKIAVPPATDEAMKAALKRLDEKEEEKKKKKKR